MKKLLKLLLSFVIIITYISSNSLAFQNGEWMVVNKYDERKDYFIDRGETCEYLVKLYQYITWKDADPIDNKFWDLNTNDYPYALPAYSLGFINGTDETTFSPLNKVSRGELTQMLYRLAQKVNPNADFSGGENIVFPDYVPDWNLKALQFAYTRGILKLKNGSVAPFDCLTLKETVEIIDATMRKTPDYTVQYPNLSLKTAYLTFDDALSQNTYTVLDTLKEYNIKATFFVTGKSDPDLLRRINNEGHIIGNHTLTHEYSKIYRSSESFWNDFNVEESYLESIIGYKPTLMRFPGGSNNTVSYSYGGKGLMKTLTKQAKERGYKYFDWNVSSGDASRANVPKNEIVNNVLSSSKKLNTINVLMHDCVGKSTTAAALPQIIEGLRDMGFAFYSLDGESYCPQFIK